MEITVDIKECSLPTANSANKHKLKEKWNEQIKSVGLGQNNKCGSELVRLARLGYYIASSVDR